MRSTTKRPGRLERRKRAVRAGLVRAGRRLFGQKGLFEARIEDLSEGAGIAKGTLYLYFDSKEALALAVVEAGFAELGEQISAAVTARRTISGRVDAIIDAHLAYFSENSDLMRVFHQMRGVLTFDRPEWRLLGGPLECHLARIAELLAGAPLPGGRSASPRRRRAIARDLFGAASGAWTVGAALGQRAQPAHWIAAVRSTTAQHALGRAHGAAGVSRRSVSRRRRRS